MKNREEFSFRNIIRRIVVDDNGKAPTIFVSVRGKLSYTTIFNKIFETDLYNGYRLFKSVVQKSLKRYL